MLTRVHGGRRSPLASFSFCARFGQFQPEVFEIRDSRVGRQRNPTTIARAQAVPPWVGCLGTVAPGVPVGIRLGAARRGALSPGKPLRGRSTARRPALLDLLRCLTTLCDLVRSCTVLCDVVHRCPATRNACLLVLLHQRLSGHEGVCGATTVWLPSYDFVSCRGIS